MRHRSREGVKLGTLNDPIRKFISVAGPEDIGIFTINKRDNWQVCGLFVNPPGVRVKKQYLIRKYLLKKGCLICLNRALCY